MKEKTIHLPGLAATLTLGRKLGQLARPGDVITLAGDLGAGKTTLTQAVGEGLGVPGHLYITSPTFSLLHEYPGRLPLYHMDLYRLEVEGDLENLGFEEYIYGDGLTVIEWPDRLGRLLPEDRLEVRLEFAGPEARTAAFTACGAAWQARLAKLDQP